MKTALSFNEGFRNIESLIDLFGKHANRAWIKQYKQGLNQYNTGKYNFWAPYFDKYFDFINKKKRSSVGNEAEVVDLMSMAHNVFAFEKNWNKDSGSRDVFLKRLGDTREVRGLLFELRIGVHYLAANYNVDIIICPEKQGFSKVPPPDLIIRYDENLKVYVECIRRAPKKARWENIEALIDDLIAALDDKRKSSVDWEKPRIVAIHIPEEINWQADSLRTELGKRVTRRFERKEYENVNVVAFSSDRKPVRLIGKGFEYYNTDVLNLHWLNPNGRYRLPDDFKLFLNF